MLSFPNTTAAPFALRASSPETARTSRPRRLAATGHVWAGRGIAAVNLVIEPGTGFVVDVPNTGTPKMAKLAAPPRGELR